MKELWTVCFTLAVVCANGVGCSNTADTNGEVAQLETIVPDSGLAQEERLLAFIDDGAGDWLLMPDGDGFLYPVKLIERKVLESYPLRVEVLSARAGKPVIVQLDTLTIPDAGLAGGYTLEVLDDEHWIPYASFAWHAEGVLGRRLAGDDWSELDMSAIRLRSRAGSR